MSAADKMGHIKDDLIERYSMGRIEEPELAEVEEHLLICPECQRRVEEEDDFVRAARAALSAPENTVRVSRSRWSFFANRWTGLVYAAVLAGVVLLYLPARVHTPVAQRVRLTAVRGARDLPAAKAESPLKLTLDTTTLSPGRYTTEIVEGAGKSLLKEELTIEGGELAVDLARGLPAGHYWVRLYRDSQPVREFGFILR